MQPPDDNLCRVCGEEANPMTNEHIPPQSVLLHVPRSERDGWLADWDEDKPYESAHRGRPCWDGHRVICGACNNEIGSGYVDPYKEFCRVLMLAVAHWLPKAATEASRSAEALRPPLLLPGIRPGAVLRHMIFTAACLDTERRLLSIPGMGAFIKGGDAPEAIGDSVHVRLVAWGMPAVLAGAEFSKHPVIDPTTGAVLCEAVTVAHLPVMFSVCLGSPAPQLPGVDAGCWKDHGPKDTKHVLMKPPICVTEEQAHIVLFTPGGGIPDQRSASSTTGTQPTASTLN